MNYEKETIISKEYLKRGKRAVTAMIAAFLMGTAHAVGAAESSETVIAAQKEETALMKENVDAEKMMERLRNAVEIETYERFLLVAHTASGKVVVLIEFVGKDDFSANASEAELVKAYRRFSILNEKDKIIGLERIHTHPEAAIVKVKDTKKEGLFIAPPSALDMVMAIRNSIFTGSDKNLLFNKEKVYDPSGIWEISIDGDNSLVQFVNKKFEEPTEDEKKYSLPPGEERIIDPRAFVEKLRREDLPQLYDLFQVSKNILLSNDVDLQKTLIEDLIKKGKEIGIVFSYTPYEK